MKRPALLLSTMFLLASTAWSQQARPPAAVFAAEGGGGTRGGGQVVEQGGKPVYADKVLGCQGGWDRGAVRLRAMAPELDDVMAALSETHWYLGYLIRTEIRRLKVCFVEGPLEWPTVIPTTLFVLKGTLIGYRYESEVFVSQTSWKAAIDKGLTEHSYFPIHEAMHGFIPAPAPDYQINALPESQRAERYRLLDAIRMKKVFSMVDAIMRNWHQRIPAKDFSEDMIDNGINVPPSMGKLDAISRDILVALDESAPIRTRRAAAGSIRRSHLSLELLRSLDTQMVRTLQSELDRDLSVAAQAGDVGTVRSLLDDGASPYVAVESEDPIWRNGPLLGSVRTHATAMLTLLTERLLDEPKTCDEIAKLKADRPQMRPPLGLDQRCDLHRGLADAFAEAVRGKSADAASAILAVRGFDPTLALSESTALTPLSMPCLLAASGDVGVVEVVGRAIEAQKRTLIGWNATCGLRSRRYSYRDEPTGDDRLPVVIAASASPEFFRAILELERKTPTALGTSELEAALKGVVLAGNPAKARLLFEYLGADFKRMPSVTGEVATNLMDQLNEQADSARYADLAETFQLVVEARSSGVAAPLGLFLSRGPMDPGLASWLLARSPEALRKANAEGDSALALILRRIVREEERHANPADPIWHGRAKDSLLIWALAQGLTRADVESAAQALLLEQAELVKLKKAKKKDYAGAGTLAEIQHRVDYCDELLKWLKKEGRKLPKG